MKRTVFMIIVLMISIHWSSAQSNVRDVVFLKNGSKIIGAVMEMVPNEKIRIQTADGSIFVYDMAEVERVTKESATIPRYTSERSYRPYKFADEEFKSRGYRGFADIGYTIGTGHFAFDRLEISTSHGYQFNPYLFLGGGMGVDIYFDSGYTEVTIPVFVDFRANFMKGPIVPFAGVKTGYTLWADDGLDGLGYYLAPSAGVKFRLNYRLALNLSVGYTMQLIDYYEYDYYYYSYYGTDNAGGVTIKVGLEF